VGGGKCRKNVSHKSPWSEIRRRGGRGFFKKAKDIKKKKSNRLSRKNEESPKGGAVGPKLGGSTASFVTSKRPGGNKKTKGTETATKYIWVLERVGKTTGTKTSKTSPRKGNRKKQFRDCPHGFTVGKEKCKEGGTNRIIGQKKYRPPEKVNISIKAGWQKNPGGRGKGSV